VLLKNIRRTALALACAALLVPATASAQIPGLPPGTIPPEVEEALDPVVTELLTTLVGLNIPGVAQATSAPGNSAATAVELGGLTVGKVSTDKNGSHATTLRLGTMELIGKNGNATGGENTGSLAQVGDVIDQLNDALCPNGVGATAQGGCIAVLYTDANTSLNSTGSTRTSTANFKAVKVRLQGNPNGIEVLPTSAATIARRFSATSTRCTDFAAALPLSGSGTLALVSLIGPKVRVGGFLAPC
jgi:hypothetical protein